MNQRFVLTLVAVLALVLVQPVLAQETTGTLTGRVVDAQGLVVPGATVTITGGQGIKSATCDEQGRFSVPFLTPGTYTVRAESKGIAPAEQKNVVVSIGKQVDVSLKLEVGGVTEAVSVSAGGDVISPTSTTTGATLTSEMLQQVPVGRTVSDTLYMAPGVSSSSTAGRANPSVAGGSGLDNQYVIDGAKVTLLANAFNLFNTHSVITYDQWTELSFGVPNPDFGKPETQVLTGHPPQFQAPFAIRLGARLKF